MLAFALALLLIALSGVANATCTASTVDPLATKDAPIYVADQSGILAADKLTLIFNWNSYGAESNVAYDSATGLTCVTPACGQTGAPSGAFARYVDTANTGFVKAGDATTLCTTHTLATAIAAGGSPASSVTFNSNDYPIGSCPTDYTRHDETWSTLKSGCGSNFFQSATTASAYNINFVYRVTYVEQLPSGDTRSVSNDYAFQVTEPTTFNVTSQLYESAGVTTEIAAQQVTVDGNSGTIVVRIKTIAACGATFATPTLPAGITTEFATAATLSGLTPSAVTRTTTATTLSAGASTDSGTLDLTSVTGFPSGGGLVVVVSGGVAYPIRYASITGNSLMGCTGTSGSLPINAGDSVTLADLYTTGPYAGLCGNSWTLTVPLAGSGACSLSGTSNVLYSITPESSNVAFTSPVTLTLQSSDSCTVTTVTSTHWSNSNFALSLRTDSNGAGNALPGGSFLTFGQTAHWVITATAPQVGGSPYSDVPLPSSYAITAIQASLGGAPAADIPTTSGPLNLNLNDGGSSGISGTATAYALYFSHLWEPTDFPLSSAITSVQLTFAFQLTYPAVTKRDGKRHWRVFQSRAATSPFSASSAGFALGKDSTNVATNGGSGSSSGPSVGVIAGLSIMGAVLVMGAAALIAFVVVRRRTKRHSNGASTQHHQMTDVVVVDDLQ